MLTYGGESVPGMDTVLIARGRYSGDALVLRRKSTVAVVDSVRPTRR